MLERRRRKKQSQKQRNEELKWRIFRSDAHLFLWLHFPKLALMPERNQISRCSSYTISKLSPSSSTCLLTLASLSLANNSNRHSRIFFFSLSFPFTSPLLLPEMLESHKLANQETNKAVVLGVKVLLLRFFFKLFHQTKLLTKNLG